MAENLVSHIVLNVSAHHMSVIGDKITASQLYQDQCQHSYTDFQDNGFGFLGWHFPYCVHNVAHQQRNDQSYGCSQKCKEQICEKQSLIWFIIAGQKL